MQPGPALSWKHCSKYFRMPSHSLLPVNQLPLLINPSTHAVCRYTATSILTGVTTKPASNVNIISQFLYLSVPPAIMFLSQKNTFFSIWGKEKKQSKKQRERTRERENPSHWFTTQMPTKDKTESGWSWKQETQSRFLAWAAGTQPVEPLPLPPRSGNQKPYLETEFKHSTIGWAISVNILIVRPNTH